MNYRRFALGAGLSEALSCTIAPGLLHEKQRKNRFESAMKSIPHPEKAFKGGEDAAFINEKLLCVCDGVGGWNKKGIDPALFTRELVENLQIDYSELEGGLQPGMLVRLKELLVHSVKKQTKKGSSTCVLALLHEGDPFLRTLNLGDSAYILARFNPTS